MVETSEAEWRMRCDLAACYRLFVRFGWTDLISTHLSVRVPGAADQYLINPYGAFFDEITASTLIKVDFSGRVVAGDHPVNAAGHEIHSSVLAGRPDAGAVLHSHTRAGCAVAAMSCGLLPLSQHAMEVVGQTGRHPYRYAPDDPEEGARLVSDLGDKALLIMENHGLLSVGRTIPEAFYNLYMLEMACKIQVDVLSARVEPILPSEDAVASLTRHTAPSPDGPHPYVDANWRALIRALDRDGVEWRV